MLADRFIRRLPVSSLVLPQTPHRSLCTSSPPHAAPPLHLLTPHSGQVGSFCLCLSHIALYLSASPPVISHHHLPSASTPPSIISVCIYPSSHHLSASTPPSIISVSVYPSSHLRQRLPLLPSYPVNVCPSSHQRFSPCPVHQSARQSHLRCS